MSAVWRRAAKRDTAETNIVAYLRAVGCSVARISGKDVPDLLIGVRTPHGPRTLLAEVKSGAAKLKPGQAAFAREWRGSQVYLLRSVEDAQQMVHEASRT